MEVWIQKGLGVLRPCTEEDAELIKAMRPGVDYKAKISMPRNARFHRKYFALLGIVFNNLPENLDLQDANGHPIQIKSIDDLLWHIKMQLGYREKRVTLGGLITYEAKSISFARMDEAEFQEFYQGSIDVILRYFLKGTKQQELEEVIALEF